MYVRWRKKTVLLEATHCHQDLSTGKKKNLSPNRFSARRGPPGFSPVYICRYFLSSPSPSSLLLMLMFADSYALCPLHLRKRGGGRAQVYHEDRVVHITHSEKRRRECIIVIREQLTVAHTTQLKAIMKLPSLACFIYTHTYSLSLSLLPSLFSASPSSSGPCPLSPFHSSRLLTNIHLGCLLHVYVPLTRTCVRDS